MTLNKCFFVSRLSGDRLQIQILDEYGEGVAEVQAAAGEPMSYQGQPIPMAVLAAAARQYECQGDYVTPDGASIDPITLEVHAAA